MALVKIEYARKKVLDTFLANYQHIGAVAIRDKVDTKTDAEIWKLYHELIRKELRG